MFLQVAGRLLEFRDLVKEVVRFVCRIVFLEVGFILDDYYMVDDGVNSFGLGQYNDLFFINIFFYSKIRVNKIY